MRYWWVNHKQTARQEIQGQYLWSPKTESNGNRSQFYDNMREARPGDLVLSYSNKAIRYVGRVAEFAITALKPTEFGSTGSYWNSIGWWLPVYWTPLAEPVDPRDIIGVIGPQLPDKYSPINPSTGRGRQKMYLAEIPQGVFDHVVAGTAYSRHGLELGGANSLAFPVVREHLDDLVELKLGEDLTLEDTLRQSLIKARRGQGRFRSNVEAHETTCRVTGVSNPALLIASHIKPWRLCETAAERLDGMNGLLLTPDADLLFDRGFITFQENGEVRRSERVSRDDLARLGLGHLIEETLGLHEAPVVWGAGAFAAEQQRYLTFHREQVFVA